MESSDDEGEVPPLLGPESAAAPSVPSVPKALQSQASTAKPPPPTASATSRISAPKPGAHLKPSSGFKKGFLSGSGSSKPKSSSKSDGGADLPTVRADADAKSKSLQLPEVQSKLEEEKAEAAKMGGGGSASWMTPELMQKIASTPVLRKAFTDPRYQGAMTEMQTDPTAAMKKYGDVPEMREFLQTFMQLMGDHFNALAEKQEAERAKVQPQLTPEQRKAQEVAQQAMADPEVREILADARIQNLLHNMQQGKPFELEREMRTNPDIVRKLRTLSEAGLIGMEWKQ